MGTQELVSEKPGPATHDRDQTVTEQPNAAHRRINEAGDSVPSSQDSVTRGSSGLAHLGFTCGTSSPASPATVDGEELQEAASTETTAQGVPSLCAVWSRSRRPASTDGGLMQHMGKNTEDNCCFRTVWGNCAGLIARPV